ncbi:MAG: response regulator transcription factor [Thiolinea sp.]
METQLLLADDHCLSRQAIAMLLSNSIPDLKIIQSSSWMETLELAQEIPFEIALVDLFMPSKQPWQDELKTLQDSLPDLLICILSAATDPHIIETTFELGAKGYLHKSLPLQELNKAISMIRSGNIYLPRQAWKVQSSNQAITRLTRRQRDVLGLLSQGYSNKQIAESLQITESTVKRHMHGLFNAFKARNRVEMLRIARAESLLPL